MDKHEFRKIRVDLGFTQHNLGSELGVTDETISRIESGHSEVNRRTELAMLYLSTKSGKHEKTQQHNVEKTTKSEEKIKHVIKYLKFTHQGFLSALDNSKSKFERRANSHICLSLEQIISDLEKML